MPQNYLSILMNGKRKLIYDLKSHLMNGFAYFVIHALHILLHKNIVNISRSVEF